MDISNMVTYNLGQVLNGYASVSSIHSFAYLFNIYLSEIYHVPSIVVCNGNVKINKNDSAPHPKSVSIFF